MRVVIAEDLALLRDGLERLLRDNGFEVVASVRDGDALLREIDAHKPDIAEFLAIAFREPTLAANASSKRLVMLVSLM